MINIKPNLYSVTVKQYGTDAGADAIGIAASADFGSAPDGFKPDDALPGCRSVVVLGAAFSKDALSGIEEYSTSRNEMVTAMTEMANAVARRIKADGYNSKAISATGGKWVEKNGRKEQNGHISLKHAAEIAGLGIIGKNYLLTNPRYGNMLWLSAVLTDAELTPDERLHSSMCDDCDICVKACPVGALDDPAAFGRNACSKFYAIEKGKFVIKCFTCRTVCPHRFGIES